MSTSPTPFHRLASQHAATQAVTTPAMPEEAVKALQDIAEALAAIIPEVPDRIHKAAVRDAMQFLLDVAIENDHRGRYRLFTQFGDEQEEWTA
jgi:hypothetical protein